MKAMIGQMQTGPMRHQIFYISFIILTMKLVILVSLLEAAAASVQIGDRPFFLVEQMEDSDLKTTLGKLPIQFESVIPPAT